MTSLGYRQIDCNEKDTISVPKGKICRYVQIWNGINVGPFCTCMSPKKSYSKHDKQIFMVVLSTDRETWPKRKIQSQTCIWFGPFLAHLSRRLVSYCHSAPSVVRKLSHFQLLLWNRWTEFNETWQEGRSLRPLPSLCFSGRSEKQDGHPGLLLAETFSTSSLKSLNGIQRNLTGSKISMSSTKFVFFGPIGKTRWPPWPLIGWDIFDFFSETAEQNSTKLDRKQDLNVFYQVCVFRADRKNKMAARPLICSDIFDFFSVTAERNSTKLVRKQDLNVLYQVCVFRADRKNKMAALASVSCDIFDFSSITAEPNSTKLVRKQDLNVLYQVYVFRADRKKQDGRPGLWFAETFSTSPLKPLNGIQRNLTGSKISMSFTKFVFFGPIRKQKWPPWLIPQKGGTLYSGAR